MSRYGGLMINYKKILKETKDLAVSKYIKELALSESDTPIFNLTDENDDTTVSIKLLYLKHYMDPTEISFIDEELCGKYALWERIKTHSRVKALYKEWVDEARARFRAERYRQIAEIAEDPTNKARFQALKYLTDEGYYVEKETKKMGRPTKEEKEGALKEFVNGNTEIKQALERAYQAGVN